MWLERRCSGQSRTAFLRCAVAAERRSIESLFDVGEPQTNCVAASQLAIRGGVEPRQVSEAAPNLEAHADRPSAHRTEWKFGSHDYSRRSVHGSLLARSNNLPANVRNGWKADTCIARQFVLHKTCESVDSKAHNGHRHCDARLVRKPGESS